MCQSLFFNKVIDLRPVTLLKKILDHRCFPINFVKFLSTPFFTEQLWWLLLVICLQDKVAKLRFRVQNETCTKADEQFHQHMSRL